MSYTVTQQCAACSALRPMHVAGSQPYPPIPGEFLCATCASQSGFPIGTHAFWGFSVDANGDVDMISCHCCGRIYWAPGQPQPARPIPVLDTMPLPFPEPAGKLGNCTICRRALCEALDATYSKEPLTRCAICRSK